MLILIPLLWIFVSCGNNNPNETDYAASVNKWHEKRIERLKKTDSWLTLAGLYWLNEGENSFGSAKDNDLVFPKDMPPYMGRFILTDTVVSVVLEPTAGIKINGDDKLPDYLKSDITGKPDKLTWDVYTWYVIRREEKTGIRLKNSASETLRNFTGIDRFPVDVKWRVKARLEAHDSLTKISVPNVLGQIIPVESPGRLFFTIDGHSYHLDPTGAPGDTEYFIIFGDATNGESTYGAGRFLVVPAADENGETWIDFNKAYNPPCVFTPYATCPLPPGRNILPIKVTAGEKVWGHH